MSEDKFTTYELAQRIVSDVRRGDMGVVGLEAALNALASQVCEQREKGKCPHPSLNGISVKREPGKVWKCDVCNGLFFWKELRPGFGEHVPATMSGAIKELAEAAELALQAKEQELGQLTESLGIEKLPFSLQLRSCINARDEIRSIRNGEHPIQIHNDKFLAQAHQQAIADLIPQLEKKRQDSLARADKWEDAKEGDKAHYWLGVAYGQGSAIYLLNALTPPPALTKEK